MRGLISTKGGTLYAVILLVLSLARALPTLAGTEFMPVPVEGELLANPVKVAIGKVTEVTFTVVPLRILSRLELSILIPSGVERVSGDLSHVYLNVKANEAINLRVRLRVNEQGSKRVVASATVFDEKDFALRKAFVLELNPAKSRKPPAIRGTDASGGDIRIQTVPTN